MSGQGFRWPARARKPFGASRLTVAVVASLATLVAALYGGCAVDLLTGDSQAKEASKVVEKYMQLMVTKRAVAAESLFARSAGDASDVHGQLQAMVNGPNYVLFDGYRALTTDGYHVQRTQYCILNSHTIELQGTVSYDDGSKGKFAATLINDEADWEILGINITVPPSKSGPKALEPSPAP